MRALHKMMVASVTVLISLSSTHSLAESLMFQHKSTTPSAVPPTTATPKFTGSGWTYSADEIKKLLSKKTGVTRSVDPSAATKPRAPSEYNFLPNYPADTYPALSDVPAKAAESSLPYALLRGILLQIGYLPFKASRRDTCSPDSECYEEMFACAGTGEGNCIFLWRKGQEIVKIHTVDDPHLVTGAELYTLRRWNAENAPSKRK